MVVLFELYKQVQLIDVRENIIELFYDLVIVTQQYLITVR